MIIIEINERTKAGKVLLAMAQLLEKEKEGVKIIGEGKNDMRLDPEKGKRSPGEILKDMDLTKKEKAFYKKFSEAVKEAKALDAGELKDRPFKEVLDEL